MKNLIIFLLSLFVFSSCTAEKSELQKSTMEEGVRKEASTEEDCLDKAEKKKEIKNIIEKEEVPTKDLFSNHDEGCTLD